MAIKDTIKKIAKEVEVKFEEVEAQFEAAIEPTPAAQTVVATEPQTTISILPTPAEAAAVSIAAPAANPILEMAKAQAAERKAKDLYHGFK
jgi:hypothetical protein